MRTYDVVIIGTGPAGLGAAFELLARRPGLALLVIDKNEYSSGGLRNDCKMNFSWPIGFPDRCWTRDRAEAYLRRVEAFLEPRILEKRNLSVYAKRAEKIGVSLVEIRQSHLGTDGGLELIKRLIARLGGLGAELSLGERVVSIDAKARTIRAVAERGQATREIAYRDLVVAPGRGGFAFLQEVMNEAGVAFTDNAVDVGVRVETGRSAILSSPTTTTPSSSSQRRPAPSAPTPARPTSSRRSTRRRTEAPGTASTATPGPSPELGGAGAPAWRRRSGSLRRRRPRGPPPALVNFAMLKTVTLTEPLASGQDYARMLGDAGGPPGRRPPHHAARRRLPPGQAVLQGAVLGRPLRLRADPPHGHPRRHRPLRSRQGHARPLERDEAPRHHRAGLLHPSTIMYYPEIKLYANRPAFEDDCFRAKPGLYLVGDGAGTSRGITAAWASGLRAADGILASS